MMLIPVLAYADGLIINSDGTTSRLDGNRLWMQNGTVGRVDRNNNVWMPDGRVGHVYGNNVWMPAVQRYEAPPPVSVQPYAVSYALPPLVSPPVAPRVLPVLLVKPTTPRKLRSAHVVARPHLVAPPVVRPAPESEFVTPTYHPSEDEQPPKGPPLK
jgi:hypothetical protein